MTPSPYTPGAAPHVLAGRREQIDAAEADVALVATFGRFQGRVRVDIGSRGVGKTSLLKSVRELAAAAGLVTVWVTARADESLVASLVHGLVRQLDRIGIDVGGRPPWRDRVQGLTVELGAGPAKAGVELDLGPSPTGTTGTGAASGVFGDLVTTASSAARERGSGGLCLIVDEIQAAPRADLRTLAYAWQELQNAVPEPAALMFAAGLPNAPDVLTSAVTFSERFAFRTLERLSAADAADALVVPADEHGVTWHPALLAAVVDLAQGYPYFLQLYGDALWRSARPDAGGVLSVDHLAAARRQVDAELETMFRARWAKAAPGERRLLAAMAALGDDAVRRGDVAERLGVTTNDLSVPRRSLIDKGLIEVAARGMLRFTVPGFAEFVRAEAGVGG
ncbi:MAG: AAA family ATPase [Nocardioides sp.]